MSTALVIPAGKNWSIKTMVKGGLIHTWNGMDLGVTICEHKYTHENNGGYYDASVVEYDGKNWLIYECSVPESVKKHVRTVLKNNGLKYNRVMDASAISNWVNDVYTYLGQIVIKENKTGEREQYMRSMAKTRFNLLFKSTEYRAYKALVDELACEQLEEYYQHVMGVKL